MTLGLKRGTVRLCEHDPEWKNAAQEVIDLLRGILGDTAVDIQHVGSTAISGIPAKPIIDLAVAVREPAAMAPYHEALAKAGVIFHGLDKPDMLYVMGDFAQDMRTHHIHVVTYGSEAWRHYLNFRDYLNAHPEEARRYAECKRTLWEKYPNDRNAYTSGKQPLIEELLAKADAWRKA